MTATLPETRTTTSATLSLSQLQEILAGGRTTEYKPTIIKFVKDEELYLNVMDIFPFSEKKIDSVFNSFNNNLKTLKADNPHWPHIEVRKQADMVLLINLDKLQGVTEDS